MLHRLLSHFRRGLLSFSSEFLHFLQHGVSSLLTLFAVVLLLLVGTGTIKERVPADDGGVVVVVKGVEVFMLIDLVYLFVCIFYFGIFFTFRPDDDIPKEYPAQQKRAHEIVPTLK